jgi:hypothetical protein
MISMNETNSMNPLHLCPHHFDSHSQCPCRFCFWKHRIQNHQATQKNGAHCCWATVVKYTGGISRNHTNNATRGQDGSARHRATMGHVTTSQSTEKTRRRRNMIGQQRQRARQKDERAGQDDTVTDATRYATTSRRDERRRLQGKCQARSIRPLACVEYCGQWCGIILLS